MKTTDIQVAEYLRDLSEEMVRQARKARLSSAASMLELVVLELNDAVDEGKKKARSASARELRRTLRPRSKR